MWSSHTNHASTTGGSPSPPITTNRQLPSPTDTPTLAPSNLRRFRSIRSKPQVRYPYEFDSTATSAASSPQPHLEIHHSTSVTVSVSASELGDDQWQQRQPSSQTYISAVGAETEVSADSPSSPLYSSASGFTAPNRLSSKSPSRSQPQGHGYNQSFTQTLGAATTSKTVTLQAIHQQQQFPDSYEQSHQPDFLDGGLFINGLASHPTFAPIIVSGLTSSESEPQITPPTFTASRLGVRVSPAVRSPGGCFYDSNRKNLFRSPSFQNESFESSPELAAPPRNQQLLQPNLGTSLDLDFSDSSWRPVSSAYSQPSPPISFESLKTFAFTSKPEISASATAMSNLPTTMQTSLNISPPSSPELALHNHVLAGDVSPIDSSDENVASEYQSHQPLPPQPKPPRNEIARMRRERKALNLQNRPSRDQMRPSQPMDETGRQLFRVARGQGMKWDAMTGEPTLGPGQSAQVKPAEYAQEFSRSPNSAEFVEQPPVTSSPKPPGAMAKLRSAQANLSGRLKGMRSTSQAAAVVQTKPQSQAPSIDSRPEWKGASGRERTVDPVRDDKTGIKARRNISASAAAGLAERAAGLSLNTSRGTSSASNSASVTPTSPADRITSPVRSETSRNNTSVPLIRKMAPSRLRSPTTSPTNMNAQTQIGYPTPPNSVDRKQAASQVATQSQNQQQPYELVIQQSPTRRIPADLISNQSFRRKPTPSSINLAKELSGSSKAAPTSSTQCNDTDTNISSYSLEDNDPEKPPAWTQPPSRFSSTTAPSTSLYSQSTDVNSDIHEPVPPIPSALQHSQSLKKQQHILRESATIHTEAETLRNPPSPSTPNQSQSQTSHPRIKTLKEGTPEMPIRMNLRGAWKPSMARDAIKASSPVREASMTTTRPVPQSPSFTCVNSPIPRSLATAQVFNSDTISIHIAAPGVKALPPAPPEASAGDRVAHLSALLSALANRRININHAITKMTELMPRDNLMARPEVVKRREEEKEKVRVLKEELAEVQREEYELGIKLHRAYKRQAREADYEDGGSLWVQRER